jgi:hypothetical protein
VRDPEIGVVVCLKKRKKEREGSVCCPRASLCQDRRETVRGHIRLPSRMPQRHELALFSLYPLCRAWRGQKTQLLEVLEAVNFSSFCAWIVARKFTKVTETTLRLRDQGQKRIVGLDMHIWYLEHGKRCKNKRIPHEGFAVHDREELQKVSR